MSINKNARWRRLIRVRSISARRNFVLSLLVICSAHSLFAQTLSQSITIPQSPAGPGRPGNVHNQDEKLPSASGRRIIGPGEAPQVFPEAKAIAQPTNDEELAASTKKLADELAKSGRFSGSIFLASDGKALVNNAWGLLDEKAKIVSTPETAYDVGSIGKLFTQIAILQLGDEGKLNLDDPIAKYVRDYPDPEIAQKVTVRQLLLHKSGIPDFLGNITQEVKLDSITEVKDFLPLFVHQPLNFEPGSAQRYSNSGYIILGLAIEAVSGENYYTYVQRRILEPAGMTRSGFFDRTHLPPFVAHSYEDAKDVTSMHPRRGSPAGGLQASAIDLFRLLQAVNAGKLIRPESVRVLRDLIPRPPDAPSPADPVKLIGYGISGGAPGVSATLAVDPNGRYTRVILCNTGPTMAISMAATIREWVNQMPRPDGATK
jgi:D-alanyl-D-alanine carboxypeptidase